MNSQKRYTLILSLLGGRNFPDKPSFSLSCTATLGGELISSKSYPHTESPEIVEEFGWELSGKQFHDYKMQRVPIKVSFIASKKFKEDVGYVMLNLKSVDNLPRPRWHHLIKTKYMKERPEVCMTVYCEEERKARPPQVKTSKFDLIQPVKLDKDGFYLIGPRRLATDQFTFSFTICSIENVQNLLNFEIESRDSFNLMYKLVGDDIVSESFTLVPQSSFSPERSTAFIRTCTKLFMEYLSKMQFIEVYLFLNGEVVGGGKVPLNCIDKIPYFQQTHVEILPVIDTIKVNANNNDVTHISVKLDLRRYEEQNASASSRTSDIIETEVHSLLEHKSTVTNAAVSNNARVKRSVSPVLVGETVPFNDSNILFPKSNFCLPIVSTCNHFRFHLQLKSIRFFKLEDPFKIFLKYVYPYFGTSSPIQTHPPVTIDSSDVFILPRSSCLFEFATSWNSLIEQFSRTPLIVEIWNVAEADTSTSRVAHADVDLYKLINAPKNGYFGIYGSFGSKQTWTGSFKIYENETSDIEIGELGVEMELDDLGIRSEATEEENKLGQSDEHLVSDAKLDMKFRAAYEFQIWKEEREAEFLCQLKEKEAKQLFELASAFKEKELEHEKNMQAKIKECESKENFLKEQLAMVESREKAVTIKEIEMKHARNENEKKFESKINELQDTIRRLMEQSEHDENLFKSKIASYEEELERERKMAREWEKRYVSKETEFHNYKENEQLEPKAKLVHQIDILKVEMSELHKKLTAANESKDYYKEQWSRLLKEIASLKQKETEKLRAQVEKQKVELEEMRLRCQLADENTSPFKEIENLKKEIEMLKSTNLMNTHTKGYATPLNENCLRLIKEREGLLRTGAYTPSDKIILELDRQIHLMSMKAR